MTFYCSAAYIDECCPKPHCFLKRIVAKDSGEAVVKFTAALIKAGISKDAIEHGEIHCLKHKYLVGDGGMSMH